MLNKCKVSELAKDFGVASKEIIAVLKDYNENGGYKTATTLDENELNFIADEDDT